MYATPLLTLQQTAPERGRGTRRTRFASSRAWSWPSPIGESAESYHHYGDVAETRLSLSGQLVTLRIELTTPRR